MNAWGLNVSEALNVQGKCPDPACEPSLGPLFQISGENLIKPTLMLRKAGDPSNPVD
jgi:hypothetical protein